MTQKETQKLKSIFLRIGKESFAQLYERFKNECENKIKLELQQSPDLSIEERIKKENISNINADQKIDFEKVISFLQDEDYVFSKKDVELLNNFTSRLNYLFIGTSPAGKGMADQVARVKNGTIWKNGTLEIDVLFNNFKKADSWSEFQNTTKINKSFLDSDFKWILIYVFSDVKNCQNKNKYPLFYPEWQITADWCFDIPQLDYDTFCKYYAEIKDLQEPRMLYFSIYFYCLRLSLKSDKEYNEYLSSLNENKKIKVMKEIRENDEGDKGEIIYQEEENNQNNRNNMENSNSHFIVEISSLSNIFSILESGSEIKYKIITPSNTSVPAEIKSGDKILVVIKDKASFNFRVEGTDPDESLVLRKTFEVDRSSTFSFQEQGKFYPITKEEYEAICSKLFSDFRTDPSPETTKVELGNIKEQFADWLFNSGKYSRVYNGDRAILVEKLNEFGVAYNTDFGISIFGYPSVSLDKIIEALETNIIEDTGEIGDLNRRTVGNGSVKAILGPKNYIKFLKELLLKSKTSRAISPKVNPVNKIYFGAPGTGKSYKITQDLKDVDLIFQKRVTFHPEYDNASFVGGYKPITDINGDIKYEFVPQIFTDIYVEACNDPFHQYYLIIEEINRGNCAEIFGELFQLLDRDEKYKITPSNELINYLTNNISNSNFYKECTMLLPDNLSVLATMNTSDQSLFPMDSAFKRRWEWEYIPINHSKNSSDNKSADYTIVVDSSKEVNWIDFIIKINKKIEENPNLGMDKCIGNYFVKPNKNNEISLDNFIHKVMFYLWNDVFKDEPKDSIFNYKNNKITYQSFFPIESEGKKQVITILENLELLKPTESAKENISVE